MPLGIALGISPYMLIALFPAVNGYFFIPNYPTVVAAINFDRTGTTKIGKYGVESFVYDARTGIYRSRYCFRTALYSNILIYY